jgi:hypothetical protein
MGNQNSREDYFKSNNINPCKFLGLKKSDIVFSDKHATKKILKKAYHKKAKELHPDKTNGETDLEFKILKECYLFYIEKLDNYHAKTHEELKTHYTSDNMKDIYYEESRDFHKTNFDDYNVRNKLFVNTVNDSNIDEIIEKKSKNPIEYSSVKTANYRDIFKGKNFDLKNFNAMFEIHGSKYNTPDFQNGDPDAINAESSLSHVEIDVHNGLLLEREEQNNFKFAITENDQFEHIPSIDDTNQKDLNANIKRSQKDNKSFSKKKLNALYQERTNETFTVDTTKSFAENELALQEIQISAMKKEMDNSRKNISRHINIFPKNLIEQYNNHSLEDSSTVIFSDRLEIPKGIRYE